MLSKAEVVIVAAVVLWLGAVALGADFIGDRIAAALDETSATIQVRP